MPSVCDFQRRSMWRLYEVTARVMEEGSLEVGFGGKSIVGYEITWGKKSSWGWAKGRQKMGE